MSAWKVVAVAGLLWFTWSSVDRALAPIPEPDEDDLPRLIFVGEDGDIPKIVSEEEFRRHHHTETGFRLAMAALGWGLLIAAARRPKQG